MAIELLKSVLIISLIGSCLTVAITLIKPITKKLFGYSWHYYIWLAVLVVMILPVRFTYSGTKAVDALPETDIKIQTATVSEPLTAVNNEITVHSPSETQTAQPGSYIITDLFYDWADSIALIWALGILVLLSVKIIGYARLLHRIHKNSVIISCPEIRKYTKRSIAVRMCKGFSSPFIMGIFRPVLILPDIQLSVQQLDNILKHEITHLNRNDILYKWFAVFVKALHWFNPFVYYVENQINMECEISCDLSVVRNMDNTQTTDYVNTIISLISAQKTKNSPLTTGMTGNKNTLKKRFTTIKNKIFVNKRMTVISIVSAVLIFSLAFCVSGFLCGKWKGLHNTAIELNTSERNGNSFNTLVVGVDEQNRADSIMLIKMLDDRVEGLSIPRNSVFDGNTITQLLSQKNGDQTVIDAVSKKLSVPVTYYARIKLDFVRDVIDAVGGLTMDVPMDMKYDDPYKNLHIDLKKGSSQALNGEQVCHLLQFRRSNDGTGYAQADLDRIKVAQQAAIAFISQNKFSELAVNSKNIFDSINKNVVTNYSAKNFIKDKKLLLGKEFVFNIIPGNNVLNNGIFEYEIVLPGIYGTLNSAVKSDQLFADENKADEHSADNGTQPLAYQDIMQKQGEHTVHNTLNDITVPEEVEKPSVAGIDLSNRLNFSSVADAEQYLQSKGKAAVEDKNFRAGSNYIINDYVFENSSNEKISNILCDDNGEVSLYFNANLDTLMSVSFTDAETRDEVNSAIILTGKDRIYKFTGLDPARNYDVELKGITKDEWKIEGQYIIF